MFWKPQYNVLEIVLERFLLEIYFSCFFFYLDEEKCQNTEQETQSGKTEETKNQSGTGSENTPRSSRPSTPFETQQVLQ